MIKHLLPRLKTSRRDKKMYVPIRQHNRYNPTATKKETKEPTKAPKKLNLGGETLCNNCYWQEFDKGFICTCCLEVDLRETEKGIECNQYDEIYKARKA